MISKKNCADWGLLALRIALGAVFIYHGWLKLSDIAMTTGFFESQGIPLPMFFAWLVGLVEFLGGIAVLLGFWTKSFATLLAINMIFAVAIVHLGTPWSATEFSVLTLGASIALAGVGAGKYRIASDECPVMKKFAK